MKNVCTEECIPSSIVIILSITCCLDSKKKCSTSHALINITGNIRKALDGGNTSCGVFIDLQKAFDTVDHQIQLATSSHYGICWVFNDWLKSYWYNENGYVSVNGFDSALAVINCGVPQESVLEYFCYI